MTAHQALNRLGKWRSILSGQFFGTQPRGHQPTEGMRSLQEARLLMRAEISALSALLLKKNIITDDEFDSQIVEEAAHIEKCLEQSFPGAKAVDEGMSLTAEAQSWLKDFPR